MFLCFISIKGIFGLCDSFLKKKIISSVIAGIIIFLKVFEMFCHLGVNSLPDLHDFYIWLLLQGTPIAVLIQRCFVVRKRGGKKRPKNKNKSLFLSNDNPPQCCGCQKLNLQDKGGECTADTLQLSPDRRMRNKRQQFKGKHIPCELK